METNIIIDENLAAVHAYLCGDGYVSGNNSFANHKYYQIGLRNTNIILLSDFKDRFKKVFGIEPIISKQIDRCNIGNKEIFFWLKENFGSFHSAEWHLPNRFLTKKLFAVWARAFFDCEGWVENQKAKSRVIGLDSINRKELKRISRFIKRIFGIDSTVNFRKKKRIYHLAICGKDDLLKFRKMIGFNHPAKKKKLDEAIESFINYAWGFPKKNKKDFVLRILKKKISLPIGNRVRICSNTRLNLLTFSKLLFCYFRIESKLSKERFNGIGTKYFELAIQKKASIRLLVMLLE